ncbi:MAG: hypothetical protein A3F67_03405 [Verrucomicrobia bacterium RIFCSPHIGHO2_12_FULL_41_10]|nr:MAG: hypothetical protein A3F67_03405 [Verrucomicrobia bacterium RIFCSPHIGHO2_12_FULL_41_10]HLB34855.1 hypothetical protein [Chthoniobacterales bacterium]
MNKSLLFALILMTAASCLTQASPSQQSLVPSNISTYEQVNTAPAEVIQPLEITIDDLVNTPWDEASPKAHVPWYSYEDFNGAQILEPLSITLEKGQDLIIHISNSKHVKGGYLPQHGFYIDERGLIYTINEIDWGRGHSLNADPYFPCRDEQGMLSYHVINSHSGKNDLTFKYCLSGSDRSGDSKVNVKKIFVTCE